MTKNISLQAWQHPHPSLPSPKGRGRITYILAMTAITALTACGTSASSKKTYTMEGNAGYTINCSGTDKNWGMCYEKAGENCQTSGYDILDVIGEQGTSSTTEASTTSSKSTTSTIHNRIMVIECKKKEPQNLSDVKPADKQQDKAIKGAANNLPK